MVGPSILKKLDVQLALLLFCVATMLSAFAYRRVAESEFADRALISSFPRGSHHYAFITPSGCVGSVGTEMRFSDDQYQLQLKGGFRVRIGDRVIAPTIDGTANFNSIGQLGGAYFTVRSQGLFLRFGFIEINPIKLQLHGAYEGTPFDYQTYIPGPVTLKENRDRSFSLEYLQFGKVAANYAPMLQHPAFEALKTSSVELAQDDRSCEERSAVLDVSNLNSLFRFLP